VLRNRAERMAAAWMDGTAWLAGWWSLHECMEMDGWMDGRMGKSKRTHHMIRYVG
jgi:hypothetical protein